MARYLNPKCRILFQIFLTASFFLTELIVGHVTKSMALVADSFHMLSDIFALIIAFVSVKMSPMKWSKGTYGYARAEVLGALVNSVFLLALCFSLLLEALQRAKFCVSINIQTAICNNTKLYEPEKLTDPQLVLYVGLAGLAINVIGLLLFTDHGHSHEVKIHKSQNKFHMLFEIEQKNINQVDDNCPNENDTNLSVVSENLTIDTNPCKEVSKPVKKKEKKQISTSSQMNIKGIFLHLIADALGSIIVIISAVIIWQVDWPYEDYVDPVLTIILVCILTKSVWSLLLESAMILLQTIPPHINIERIRKRIISEVENILSIHELHVWQLTGDRVIASVHVRCRNPKEYEYILIEVKRIFHQEHIHATTVQPEFVEMMSVEKGNYPSSNICAYECPSSITDCKNQVCCIP